MKLLLLLLLIIPFFNSTFAQNKASSIKHLAIIGKWAFEQFEFVGWLKDIPDEKKASANKAGKGLVLTFTSDNKYIAEQKGGLKENNYRSSYRLINAQQFIAFRDTITILVADAKQLKLYRNPNSPLAVFKRIE